MMEPSRKIRRVGGSDAGVISLSAHKKALERLPRRMLLRGTLSVGALTLLTGCHLPGHMDRDTAVDRLLWAMSRWNDRVQAALFSSSRMAPVYTDADITTPFRFNANYEPQDLPPLDEATYRLDLSGLVTGQRRWSLAELRALPAVSQVTRIICIEGWSVIGKWGGIPFHEFLARVGADTRAKYISIICSDGYRSSIDMASALHPQTLLAYSFSDHPLNWESGFPLKLRVPTKLGYKNPKLIMAIEVTNTYPGGLWEDRGYNWFSGL
jgi:DMSO/TMAO reductase YedYZ molybdopterin-dependent catalytic subunit